MTTKTKNNGYKPLLGLKETERGILLIKDFFQRNLSESLNLTRVTAPIFVEGGTGINDDLNGIERPISFAVPALNGKKVEIVQSLAKWKRLALAEYGFAPGEGIYTDMNAIRPDETLDELHSIYVDQWDWERVISGEERNLKTLLSTVEKIYEVVLRTERYVSGLFPAVKPFLPEKITFIHTEELERRYPTLSRVERDDKACEEHGAVFIIGVGAPLKDGKPHDGRAPDYDDWSTPTEMGPGLNGDILVWNPVLARSFEFSSMGIRVDAEALVRQLKITGTEERANLYFHKRLISGDLPLTMGGGIGQSRLCMFFMRKAHIGEVQCGVWDAETRSRLKKENIVLL
ncbi:MAG: aspartate--ammonia ligase [Myxococcota bacterium]